MRGAERGEVIYGSVCSGIEAATVAWAPLGWQCAFVAEMDPYCCSLLKHYYPGVPNLGDMTKVDWSQWRWCGNDESNHSVDPYPLFRLSFS